MLINISTGENSSNQCDNQARPWCLLIALIKTKFQMQLIGELTMKWKAHHKSDSALDCKKPNMLFTLSACRLHLTPTSYQHSGNSSAVRRLKYPNQIRLLIETLKHIF